MNEQKNDKRGIFYGVIGVATLVVAIIGATFAYFTASATAGGNNLISGNLATITFDLKVEKVTHVDDNTKGIIPLSNSMIEAAVRDTDDNTSGITLNDASKNACVDNAGNAVCQIYKVTVTNTGTAGIFVDGFVTLTGGSGYATDYPANYYTAPQTVEGQASKTKEIDLSVVKNPTTMRWAQVFCDDVTLGEDADARANEVSSCSTAGQTSTLAKVAAGDSASVMPSFSALAGPKTAADAFYTSAMLTNLTTVEGSTGVTSNGYIANSPYPIIDKNYIRLSNHASGANYTRADDVTSALVFNQFLEDKTKAGKEAVLYFVVWLSETGTNQTGTDQATGENPNNATDIATGAGASTSSSNFFNGLVTFNSAQGSEVSAAFSSYTAVLSDQNGNKDVKVEG